MKQILIVGMNPHTIDFSQPGFLPGLTAEKVEAGLTDLQDSIPVSIFEKQCHVWIDGQENSLAVT